LFISQEDRTALMWAAMNGHTDVVKALIEQGVDLKGRADVDAKEKVRRTYCVNTGWRE
jgi:ankyrin repeat protein